ncbi:hypothetical protein [Agaribacter marinus]|uniref:MSHA biogenesis protein MshI n=1 Tax=Agaribacter marinus TaxID=1431249 RepID=A0AA37WLJ8_9ALTE|nr:hypothetical protein [Agaribacter marinus]GLR72230.1 hypothetical protein GCM10007852_31380 [Agaribacter marinus]
MKYRINLYHEAFKPKFDVFAFGHLVLLSSVAFGLAILIYGWTAYAISKSQTDLLAVNKATDAAEAQIVEFTQAIQLKAGDPRLAAKLTRVTDTVNAQNELLVSLQQLSTQHNNRFSSVLDAFSVAATDELWLTSFSLSGKDVLIHGQLSAPSALPLWVGKLAETGTFRGQNFQDAVLERSDDVLSFSLTNIVSNAEFTQGANRRVSENNIAMRQANDTE